MASFRPLFSNFLHLLLLLLLHLGCFIFTSSSNYRLSKKRKLSESPPPPTSPPTSRLKLTPSKALSSSWSFLKRLFSSKPTTTHYSAIHQPILSPSSSTRSLSQPIIIPLDSPDPPSTIHSDQHFFPPLRNNVFPCPICGEIFHNLNLLEQHQSVKHAVSELLDGDTGKNIVSIIFKTGWPGLAKDPTVHRILKIHCSPKILTRFEEYRECVMSSAARNSNGAVRRRDERCIADGNELLRFHCTTFLCELGQNGNSTLCNHQYCSVCGIIKNGFSPKMDGISTLPSSWRAHVSIPEEIEEEFKFMHVKRAMLLCRVIAGRIGCDLDDVSKLDPGFDSLAGRGNGGGHDARLDGEDELLVFNPRAVLPCFVIVYTV